MKTHPARRQRRAFTIIEVMFVLIIIGLIGSIVAFNLVGIGAKARTKQTKISMNQIAAALKMYHGNYGFYPAVVGPQAIQVLVDENLIDPPVLDGWGREFDYYAPASNGAAFELISYGPDGPDGSPEDDIVYFPEH